MDRDGQISYDSIDYKIILLIKQNPYITQAKMSKELSLGRTTITNHIRKLKDNNLIERIGPDNGGYWKLK